MNRIFEAVRKTVFWFSIVSMAIMLAIIFLSVGTRYLFRFTFDWAEELARYLFVWAVFLGSALMMGENGHLVVGFIPNKLKGSKAGTVLEAFAKLSGFVFVLILGTQGWKMTTMMMFQTSPGLNIPMGIVYSVIPLSSILMLMYMVRDALEFLRGSSRPRESSAGEGD